MTIYVILDNEIHDAEAYDRYKAAVPALVAKHGGEYLARDGAFDVMVGDWKPNRIVIFKWPSREALNNLMSDPEYLPWKELRESVTTTNNLMIVDGID